jgi:tetratricopeptide (TPR) repeat protein
VNAVEPSAAARLDALVNGAVRMTAHEHAYGNEKLARLYMDRRDFAAALPYVRASFEAEPGNARYAVNLGVVLNEIGRVGEAIPLLERAVAMAPDRWDAAYNLGLCYTKVERYAEAARVLAASAASGGDRPDVHHLWGLALYRSGQADSAVHVWTNVMRRWPEYTGELRNAAPGGVPTGP